MSLEDKSKELKDLIATYDTQWLLGELTFLMHGAGGGFAKDELGELSSPQRQLYYLGGLLLSSAPPEDGHVGYKREKWNRIVKLLNEIEGEYDKLFMPSGLDAPDEYWWRVRSVAVPSFLAYFNQGPMKFEEQPINWIAELYPPVDAVIREALGVTTADLLKFYDNLDKLHQSNFRKYTMVKTTFRPDWQKYTKVKVVNTAPPIMQHMFSESDMVMAHFMWDKGMADRFFPDELATDGLSREKVNRILCLLSCERKDSDFLYYTSTKPANPLFDHPIVDIGDGLYQVFEVVQVIHAIDALLERICVAAATEAKFVDRKGKVLEKKMVALLSSFFGPDARTFTTYFIDGAEQDILVLWKRYAFIIEGKGYALREPLRDPDKAFVRIKDDFKKSIGYAYTQCQRVERKFIDGAPLQIRNKSGVLIEEIDTTQYDENFSIIVNLRSFGQVQIDLSALIKLEGPNEVYPWAVRFDDLEVFLLTMKAQEKGPWDLIDFLILREELHGRIVCSDECQICGGYLTGQITDKMANDSKIVLTHPEMADIFDQQYQKGLGFANEKLLKEKTSGKYMFI
jgi:hypothetical protein